MQPSVLNRYLDHLSEGSVLLRQVSSSLMVIARLAPEATAIYLRRVQ